MSSSQARRERKKNEKLRNKAKEMVMREYKSLMSDPKMKEEMFKAIDNANVAVDKNGKMHILYQDDKDLSNLN